MNIKETKAVVETITLLTKVLAYRQLNNVIPYVGQLQDDGSYAITKEKFPFIFVHLN